MTHPLPFKLILVASLALTATLTTSAHAEQQHPWSCDSEEATTAALAIEDKETLAARWRSSPGLRKRLGSFTRYQKLRPLYIRAGVCDLGQFMTDAVVTTRFLGRPMIVHTMAVTPLARVEEALTKATTPHRHGWRARRGRAVRFRSVGTFHPRSIRTPYGSLPKLSKHGLGLAMDIDPKRNPFLSVEELEVLTLVSGVSIDRSSTISAGARWDAFQKAAKEFRVRSRPWLRRTAQSIRALRAKQQANPSSAQEAELKRLEGLYKLARGGRLSTVRGRTFMSLPRNFVVAMEEAGFTWSTDFPSGADLMHFELRRAP